MSIAISYLAQPFLLVCMTDMMYEAPRELFDVDLKNHGSVIPVRLHLILIAMVLSCVNFDRWQEVVEVYTAYMGVGVMRD
jgi:hypothetical protein